MRYSIYYESFVMSVHSLIETWLSETTLVMGGSRALNEDGFCSMPYGTLP